MLGFILSSLLMASPVKSDERVILFPVAAHFDVATDAWVGEIHGWIYEPEESSRWRREIVESLEEAAELDRVEWDDELLRARALPFLADNERNKQLEVRVSGITITCDRSGPNGHFVGAFSIPRDAIEAGATTLDAAVVLREDDERRFTGTVHLVPIKGVSVISDIDDTIKITNVLNKPELLRNTFGRPFAPVPGMPEVYQSLAERGAAFHYVSASPWQLYEPLEAFRAQNKFPAGTFDMKTFRAWDESWHNLLANSTGIKTPAIERLLKEFPERKFILIGDSGEVDPEIYGAMARAHADQILGIAIRSVREQESLQDERFQVALREVAEEKLLLFTDPKELKARATSWGWENQRDRDTAVEATPSVKTP